MKKEVSVIGGDLRQLTLARCLAEDGFDVKIFGFDKDLPGTMPPKAASCEEAAGREMIILPIPVSSDNENINAPFAKQAIHIDHLIDEISADTLVFAGKPSRTVQERFAERSIMLHDYFDREELMVKNAIATVEGALEIAIAETPKTIYNSRCLVLGYGRIGKILSRTLQGLGAHVSVSARKCSDFAWIEANGYTVLKTGELEDSISQYEMIFNTVPAMVLDRKVLSHIAPDTLVIDLASKPGGVDFSMAKEMGLKVIWALSLPGKVAPITSGEIIKDTILNMLNELEV